MGLAPSRRDDPHLAGFDERRERAVARHHHVDLSAGVVRRARGPGAITLPAPGRFSRWTLVSSRFESGGARARAMASLLAPGENGTTIRISFGPATGAESCASAAAPAVSAATPSTNRI